MRYPIPARDAHCEISVSNSRFLAAARHTPDVAAARAHIAAVRAAHPTANHHCFAYLIGYGSSVTAGMSDDGEPAGTAGRPMLAVLRGANLGDVALVVTRYFGGTLLGTGGLVRAYSDAAKAVLTVLPRVERVMLKALHAQVGYADYAAFRRLLEAQGAQIDQEDFADAVRISARLPADGYKRSVAELAELSAGRAILSEPSEGSAP